MKRILMLAVLMSAGCAKVWDSAPVLGGVRSWHDDERGVTCWITGSADQQHGIAISCLPDSALAPRVKP